MASPLNIPSGPQPAQPPAPPPAPASAWRPLRIPLFRNLLIADLVSDIGTFMQTVGAAWLMVSLNGSPMYIALISDGQRTAFFLLALPAGSVGDIVDRRKLILGTESWMMGMGVILAVGTIAHVMSPWLLLVLTFGLSAGDAIEAPSWRAILPELVPKEDLDTGPGPERNRIQSGAGGGARTGGADYRRGRRGHGVCAERALVFRRDRRDRAVETPRAERAHCPPRR